MRKCTKCLAYKKAGEFYKAERIEGYQSRCKKCMLEDQKEYAELRKTPEWIAQSKRSLDEIAREYCQKHPIGGWDSHDTLGFCEVIIRHSKRIKYLMKTGEDNQLGLHA